MLHLRGRKNAYKFLVRKSEGKLRPRRPKRIEEDDIKMAVKELGDRPWPSWLNTALQVKNSGVVILKCPF